ncbi:hypothetical protein [Azospirillum argentinense]|uniref:hypothetical protein n=1 Tax=Azospirillum argentinense TaxID=2970906 RepID=UPI0032E01162
MHDDDEMVHGADPRPVPRVASVSAEPGNMLVIQWQDGGSTRVDLSGWIAFHDIAELRDESVFSRPEVGEYGWSVQWNGNEDLSIDTAHLRLIAEQQAEFTTDDLVHWQDRLKLSNRESAELMGVALSTWGLYRTGGTIPAAVQIACRAFERDPSLFEARYRPSRPPGRPPKAA